MKNEQSPMYNVDWTVKNDQWTKGNEQLTMNIK